MLFSSFIILASASTTFAWSNLFERAKCNADNCARAVTGSVAGQTQTRQNRPSDCAAFLAYTVTPDTVTVTETASFTSPTTLQSVITTTAFTTATVVANVKRDSTAVPSAIPPYASPCSGVARYSSACSCAGWLPTTTVTAEAPRTTTTIDVTSTATIVELSTQTVEATSTVTIAPACSEYPIVNSGFEEHTFNPWTVYNPIGGAGGSWMLTSGHDSTRGDFVARCTLLNPDPSKYGGFLGFISQTVNTCVGRAYTLTFQYQCVQLSNGASVQVAVGGKYSSQLTCQSANTWYTGSLTMTASSTKTDIYIEPVQNGLSQSIMEFDNIVFTLN